jgi:hypothetical protein
MAILAKHIGGNYGAGSSELEGPRTQFQDDGTYLAVSGLFEGVKA